MRECEGRSFKKIKLFSFIFLNFLFLFFFFFLLSFLLNISQGAKHWESLGIWQFLIYFGGFGWLTFSDV